MTHREQQEAHNAQAHVQRQHLECEREAFIAASLAPVPSPAEPLVEAIRAGLTPESPEAVKSKLWPSLMDRPLREDEAVERAIAKHSAGDAAHDERTEGYARRSFRTNPHE